MMLYIQFVTPRHYYHIYMVQLLKLRYCSIISRGESNQGGELFRLV